jgi:spoIIIJ-associated protein
MLSLEKEKKICALVEEITGMMNMTLKASLFESQGQIEINVSGADRAYLITDNGETLLSLQYILGRMIRLNFPELDEVHILLDSDGYMYRHESDLRRMAQNAVQRVRRERRRFKLPPLNPYDRRIIHIEVSQNRDMESLSEGEGFFKKIVVQRRGRAERY